MAEAVSNSLQYLSTSDLHAIAAYLKQTQRSPTEHQALLAKGVLGSELDKQIKYQSARQVSFAVDFETLPSRDNRIVPSTDRFDAIGIPVPKISFDVDDYWNAGRDAALKDLDKIATIINSKIVMTDVGHQNREHIMGTMIMGADPADSVVDGDCRTREHHNLFIAGAIVIPAVVCVNPTLTGAALSLRLAAKINAEM